MTRFSQCLNGSGRLRVVKKQRISVNHLQAPFGVGKGVQQALPVLSLSWKVHAGFTGVD
jgi:hypothetical protein